MPSLKEGKKKLRVYFFVSNYRKYFLWILVNIIVKDKFYYFIKRNYLNVSKMCESKILLTFALYRLYFIFHLQIICDGARLYAEKIHSILERNCYYDDKLNAEFDVNDRVKIQ